MRGKVRHYGSVGGGTADVDRALRKIVAQGTRSMSSYEAGPCDYALYRRLAAKRIDCTVVAPSRIPKRGGGRVKTDRRDAETMARLEEALRVTVARWRLCPVVQALRTLRGGQLVIVATPVAEIADIGRFDHPRQLMAYLGLVPSEHSSGPANAPGRHHQVRQQPHVAQMR